MYPFDLWMVAAFFAVFTVLYGRLSYNLDRDGFAYVGDDADYAGVSWTMGAFASILTMMAILLYLLWTDVAVWTAFIQG